MEVIQLFRVCFTLALFVVILLCDLSIGARNTLSHIITCKNSTFIKANIIASDQTEFLALIHDGASLVVKHLSHRDGFTGISGSRGNEDKLPLNQHNPRYFSDKVSVPTMIGRMNIANVHMGCRVATWVYEGYWSKYRRLNECKDALQTRLGEKLLASNDTQIEQYNQQEVQPYDTIYIPMLKLEHFLDFTLPTMTVPFVLLSGQSEKLEPFSRHVFEEIVNHPLVEAWFLQNLPVYASYNPTHPKLHPWPYGIHWLDHLRLIPEMVKEYSAAETAAKSTMEASATTKNASVYVGYVRLENNPQARKGIPSGPKVSASDYYQMMHQSRYVLSPDGDRPECYRHYEAIALGTVPVTQLDPVLYRHLAPGPVVFYQERDTGNRWNVSGLEATLPTNPTVNRRLIFAEYWMEYAERAVGRPLGWWDSVEHCRTTLANVTKTVMLQDTSTSEKSALLENLHIPKLLGDPWGDGSD